MKITTVYFLAILLAIKFGQIEAVAQVSAGKPLDYVVVPSGEGYKLGTGSWKLTTNNTGGSIAMCEFNNKDTTDWNWVPSHVHTREDEIWYVVEGELTFKIGNQLRSAGPGSVVFGPRNMMHSYRISKAPAKYLLMLTPAGIDLLFLEVDSISKRFPRGSSEFIKKIAPLGEKYGAYHPQKWDSILNVTNPTGVLAQDPREPEIRRLEKIEREAVLKGDTAVLFDKLWSPKMVVNTPANRVGTVEATKMFTRTGKLNYTSFERTIEKITFNDDLAIVMGEEKLKPRGLSDNAGKLVTRRFTNIWKFSNNSWSIIARQSTIIKVE